MGRISKYTGGLLASLAAASAAAAQEPGTPPLPENLVSLAGCWHGTGEVLGKPVDISLHARPIVLGVMLAVDTSSAALNDPNDRYAAHLLFGTAPPLGEGGGERIVGYWSDSFGGAYAATGEGQMASSGFEITYHYPDQDFVNRWSLNGSTLVWEIVARDKAAGDKHFAAYRLMRAECNDTP